MEGQSSAIMEGQTSSQTPLLEGQTSALTSLIGSYTISKVFIAFKGRRAGILKAMTCDVHEFFLQCDPGKDNLCLYAYEDGSWEVNAPQGELPPSFPEPTVGINFCRDGMLREDWLSFVATHSDSWLLSVAYYLCAPFGQTERKQVFDMINDLPTVLDLVEGKKARHDVIGKKQAKANTMSSIGKKEASVGSKKKAAIEDQATPSQLLLPSPKKKEEILEDNNTTDSFCGICGVSYKAGEFWIACDNCDKWFHGKCGQISSAKAACMKHYKCPLCRRKKARR